MLVSNPYQRIRHYLEASESTALIVYHRTKSHDSVESIKQNGFISGRGAHYGPGAYNTYDVGSQLTANMEKYGKFIIKSKVNTHNFIDLDANNSSLASLNNYIREQLIPHQHVYKEWVEKLSKGIEYDPVYTAKIAFILSKSLNIYKYFNGMTYTGSQDGKCCVVYNPRNIIPFAYSDLTPSRTRWQPVTITGIEWHSIVNKELITKHHGPGTVKDSIRTLNFRHLKYLPKGTRFSESLSFYTAPVNLPALTYSGRVQITDVKVFGIASGARFLRLQLNGDTQLLDSSISISANTLELNINTKFKIDIVKDEEGIFITGIKPGMSKSKAEIFTITSNAWVRISGLALLSKTITAATNLSIKNSSVLTNQLLSKTLRLIGTNLTCDTIKCEELTFIGPSTFSTKKPIVLDKLSFADEIKNTVLDCPKIKTRILTLHAGEDVSLIPTNIVYKNLVYKESYLTKSRHEDDDDDPSP